MASSGTQPGFSSDTEQQFSGLQITKQQRWEDLGLVLLVAVVPLVLKAILSLIYWPLKPAPGATYTRIGIFSNLLHEFISLVLVAYVLRRQRRTIKTIGMGFHWADPLIGAGLAIGGLFLSTMLSIVIRNASFLVTGKFGELRDPRVIFAGATPLLFLIYGMASSIFEETVVRGFLMTEMIGLKKPVWVAALTSIVLQTSYHVYYGIPGALSLSGVFIVSALYFARARRLLPVIICHACVDLIATWSFYH